MNKILLTIIILVVIGGAGWLYLRDTRTPSSVPGTNDQAANPVPAVASPDPIAPEHSADQALPLAEQEQALNPDAVLITYTNAGYSPASVTIKKGTTTTFKNAGTQDTWPASAMHPTHTVYPGSDIKKCGTATDIFDACRGLTPGESWSFIFTEVGEWGYHDHLHARQFGSITVEK